MPANGYFIDANLLLLLVVGSVSPDAIARHRRLRVFTRDDYDILINQIGQVERVLVTPNTLTETSNLLGWTLRNSSGVSKGIDKSVVQSGRDFPYIRVGGGQ